MTTTIARPQRPREPIATKKNVSKPSKDEKGENIIWQPFPGPQTLAYYSPADELFYGGSAGSGKTDLLLGLAGTGQINSLILRREFPRIRGMIERSREIYNRLGEVHSRDSYNEQLHLWRLADGKTIEFGALQYEKDWMKFQGRPHDLKAFDEITEFTKKQFISINIWNRSADPNVRCRAVCTGNPPTTIDGEWVIDYWGPWLDEKHPNPARPGDLVWYVRVKVAGEDEEQELEIGRTTKEEVEELQRKGLPIPRPIIEMNGKVLEGRSRTFIPGKVEDNPALMATGYDKTLESLPEELRIRFKDGVFKRVQEDSEYQVIPIAWVDAAMQRWRKEKPFGIKQGCIGVDPARGCKDKTAISTRYGNWFDVVAYPGRETPDGLSVASLVFKLREHDSQVNIDVVGVGSSPVDVLRQMGISATALNGAEASKALDRSGKIGFVNKRAEWYWKMRELLDPEYNPEIALPPDPELKSDLCSARWKLQGFKIAIEPKDDIKKRIGRSPDKGEAIIYAMAEGNAKTGMDLLFS